MYQARGDLDNEQYMEIKDEVFDYWRADQTGEMFTERDIEEAIKECNFNKGMGEDGFDGSFLT